MGIQEGKVYEGEKGEWEERAEPKHKRVLE